MATGQPVTHRPPGHRRRGIRRRTVGVLVSIVVVAGLVIGGLSVWNSVRTDSGSGSPAMQEATPALPVEGMTPTPEVPPDAPTAEAVATEASVRVTQVVPNVGSSVGGEAIVISGEGFSDGVAVRVGDREASSVQVLNAETLRVLLPPGLPGDATIEVTEPTSLTAVVVEGLFGYADRPPRVVMAIRPVLGRMTGGTPVTIVGTGFESGARVVIGGQKATDVEVLDSTRITALSPSHEAGVVDVVVRNPGMPAAILPGAFEFVPGPTVESVTPTEIPDAGGGLVTVTGSGFEPGIEVTFNGLPASDVRVLNPTTLTALAPVGVPGPATVIVTNPGQPPASLRDAAVFVVPPPVVPEPLPEPVPMQTPEQPSDGSAGPAPVPEESTPAAG